jgi:hypothetical protein
VDGTPFGRYRLVELLGRGGMGEVWRAHDSETDRVVAIKLLPAFLSGDEEFKHRFRREAHAAARLNDPHVIPIHHYGEIDGQLYVDMRLIEGRDLQTFSELVPSARCSSPLNVDRETLAVAWNLGHLPRDRTKGLSVGTGFTVLFVTAGVKPEQNRRARGVPGTTRVAGSLLQV